MRIKNKVFSFHVWVMTAYDIFKFTIKRADRYSQLKQGIGLRKKNDPRSGLSSNLVEETSVCHEIMAYIRKNWKSAADH